jgi:hypothetical protein
MRNRQDPSTVVVRSVPLEFNHRYLTQRLGSGAAHEAWNLDMMTRWGHESVDRFRHAGWDLIKILEGPNSFK